MNPYQSDVERLTRPGGRWALLLGLLVGVACGAAAAAALLPRRGPGPGAVLRRSGPQSPL